MVVSHPNPKQREFTKVMSAESFAKEHLYNIRHAYGKEGKRTDYSPYSCMKIIMGSPPSAGHSHGCPCVPPPPEP